MGFQWRIKGEFLLKLLLCSMEIFYANIDVLNISKWVLNVYTISQQKDEIIFC